MSLRSYEAEILAELKRQPGLSAIRQKDIMEWRTTELEPQQDGERVVHLNEMHVWVCFLTPPKKAAKRRAATGRTDG